MRDKNMAEDSNPPALPRGHHPMSAEERVARWTCFVCPSCGSFSREAKPCPLHPEPRIEMKALGPQLTTVDARNLLNGLMPDKLRAKLSLIAQGEKP